MNWVAGVDEVASETQMSEGWTYAVLPDVAISAIDSAVSSCSVKTFHGKKFKKAQAADYETFLAVARAELLNHQNAFLTFTLLEISWKTQFLGFASRLILLDRLLHHADTCIIEGPSFRAKDHVDI